MSEVPPDGLVTLAREGEGPHEVALRPRTSGGVTVHELIVDGSFAMDSAEFASEQELARVAHAHLGRVLVGGLGLGYTAQRLILDGAAHVDVIELSEPLLRWARAGLTPALIEVASSPVVTLHHADVADVLRDGLPGEPNITWDAVLLDVDNGPDFLLHDFNGALYEGPLLAAALNRVASGGMLAIWCQQANRQLADDLCVIARDRPGARVAGVDIPVRRGDRAFTYVVYVVTM